jgi:hypothetical protein
MKYKLLAQRTLNALASWWTVALLSLVGLVIHGLPGGFVGGAIGFAAMCAMEILWFRSASDMEWSDIEWAVRNYDRYYRPGIGKIVFKVAERKIFFEKREVFRVTKGECYVVWYKTKQWMDLLNEKDEKFFTELCGKEPVHKMGLDERGTALIPQQKNSEETLEVCLALIKHLTAKTGKCITDMKACVRMSGPSVWVEPRYQEVSPVPIVAFNFKGKKDGRPVITLTDRKGYWILQEDGELDPFPDFDAWWNPAT